ncbi:segregation/condensation protein A [Mycoplasmopsis sturni]|uniref:segregation/condensation protein A n=1 Tax=Mycoplasmopsis sturni TaxID=39047 RepID=UPI00055F410B|nr:segregation/condensation protein A [Mycoplasmopsis sturni]
MNNQEYTFKINEFNGPLDLLLALIKDKKISIMEVDLVELANQYLEILNQIKEHEIDLAGDYLLMAATLINLKSKMVLKEPEEIEEVQQEKEILIQQLIEYQKFKEVKEDLKIKEQERQDLFMKKRSNPDEYLVDLDDSRLDGHSNAIKLINVMHKMFERVYAQKLRSTKINTIKLSPSDQIPFIKKLLNEHEKVTAQMVFNLPSLSHFVITFLAILDLSRQQQIIIHEDEEEILILTKGSEYEQ